MITGPTFGYEVEIHPIQNFNEPALTAPPTFIRILTNINASERINLLQSAKYNLKSNIKDTD